MSSNPPVAEVGAAPGPIAVRIREPVDHARRLLDRVRQGADG